MCFRPLAVKSVNSSASKYFFVPCGCCEECRDSKKMQWTFRNRCELLNARNNGWHIAFFTLTYNQAHLPLIPDYMIPNNVVDRNIQCFSRRDVRLFIDNIRKRCNEKFHVKNLRYLIASEFGSATKRSHYHGIICFPPIIEPKFMFELVKRSWKDNGFVFPRCFDGGVDSHGYRHKPFLLQGDVVGAAEYAAKYCCKDIGWFESIKGIDFIEDKDTPYCRLKDFQPFHVQSVSFGKCYLSTLSNDVLFKKLKDGESFVGDLKTRSLPLYIKNKLLFDLRYEYHEYGEHKDWWYDFEYCKWRFKKNQGTHCRYVRRDAKKFLIDNAKEIYQQKFDFYYDLFSRMTEIDFWKNRGLTQKLAINACDAVCRVSLPALTEHYLCRYGVQKNGCNVSLAPHIQWLSRYIRDTRGVVFCGSSFDSALDSLITFACSNLRYASAVDKGKREAVRKLKDFYKHLI